MQKDRNDQERSRAGGSRPDETSPGRQAGMSAGAHADIEASETDGRGTGGMGEDAGGYTELPEDET